MNITINTTPTSISITDTNKNRVSIVRVNETLEYHSHMTDNNKNSAMYKLATEIKGYILRPKNKDNYKVRFDKLAKALTSPKITTLIKVRNAIASV